MDTLLYDIRCAISSIRRRPLAAAAVILTLGLGIGANATIFRAFTSTFLQPLPFRDEATLVRLFLANPTREARLSPRPDVFLAVRGSSRSLESVAAQRFNDFTLMLDGQPHRISGIEVSEGWARTLGITPRLGRAFSAQEEREGDGSGVALISDSMWRSRYAASPSVLGQVLTLDGRPFSVVGVLPPGVRFPYEAEVWIPARFDQRLESTWGLNIVARLKPGVTPAAAQEELRLLGSRLPEVQAHQGMHLLPQPLRETLVEDDGKLVAGVSITAVFLLLLVTANVAALLAAHSLSRRREFAIRSALGAGFGRHLRQTVTEGLVLATAGGVLALAIARMSGALLKVLVPGNLSYVFDEPAFDLRVILFAAVVVVVSGCLFGLIPALRVSRFEPQSVLAGGERTTNDAGTRTRAAVTNAAQLAVAVILLASAHAMIRDVAERSNRDLGYDPVNLHTAAVALPLQRYDDAGKRDAFFDSLVASLQAVPGVQAAGTVDLFPAAGQGTTVARIEGEGVPYRADSPLLAHRRLVHGRLLTALGPRLLRGRLLSERELQGGEAVTVISKGLAESLWPGADPIGKRIRNRRSDDAPWLRVVGVVGDLEEFYDATSHSIWEPVKLHTATPAAAQAVLVVRSSTSPESVNAALRGIVRKLDPSLAVYDFATAEELFGNAMSGRKSAGTLSAAFAALGLLVAAIGVYASLAFAMQRRTRELAIRMALGASSAGLMRHFLGASARVIFAGALLGVVATLALARVAGGIAEGLRVDSVSLAFAALTLGSVALLASWLPLRRSLRLEAATVLRSE